jgi:uroporphyrinogen-III decarboxylase
MFTDIMFPVLGMGVDVELVENVGPVIERPIRTRADVDRLVVPEPEESGADDPRGGSASCARSCATTRP